jgi:hypothetical protein
MNAHLLAPTPPRDIESMSVDKAWDLLDTELGHVLTALTVNSLSTLQHFVAFFESIAKSSFGVLSRSRAWTLFMPNENVLGRISWKDLVRAAVYGRVH